MIHTGGESFDVRDGAAAIAVEPDSAVVTIPDAHFLFTADFKRKGPDLVLTGEDGRKMLVPDYFRQEKHPDLASPEGALLSASMVELLSGSAAPGQYAQAGTPAAQQPVGRVEAVTGSAQVVRNGVAIELNVGDLVFQGDVAQTRTNSTLAIAFSDGSAFTLNENARMALNEFVYDPNSTTNSAVINLVQGTVSFIAAQVAKTGNMRVETPTATLGIRGTFITVSVSSTDGNTVASLGLETNQTTGEQYSGVFTLTNKISGNQVTVSQVASMFSVSPAGMISESPKPAGIAALESATFQALIPVMNAAASFGATTGTQNLNQNINQNAPPAQNAPQDSQKGGNQGPSNSPSSGPASGGSSGPSQTYDSKSPVDNSKTISLSSQPTADPTPVNTPPANTPPVNTLPVNTPPANTPPVNPTPADTTPHVTPTATVTNVTDIETASVRAASFNIGAHVSIANAGTPTGYVSGSATLVSATVPGGLPSTLTDAAFLSSLLMIDPDGTVRYDSSKFAFLADGQSLSYVITFDVKSGTDTLHLALTFTVTGVNEAPTITVGPADTKAATIIDDIHATTLATFGTMSFRDADVADVHSLSFAVKSGPAIGSFAVVKIADTTGADSTVPDMAGDIEWIFAADKAHLQSLAAGETETEVFTITLSDGHGGTTSEDVTVTVVGVNDAPTITAASTVPTGAFSELASKTNDTADKDQASGTIAFADPDLTDHHLVTQALPTFTWSAGTLTAAQKAALTQASTLTLVEADSTGTGFGSVAWKYQITDSALDFLAAGEKLTVTYNVTVDDGHGGTVTQPLTVTITGTNDDANISVGSGDHDARAVTEDAHESATETTSGTLSFSDVDLTDHHSVTGVTASSGALGTLTASVTHDTSGTGTGGVLTWNYSVADSAIDYLAAGQTKVETFTVSLFDGTSTVTKDVTVTITGTNDAPVAVADIAAATEDALPNTVNGNVLANDTDVDNGDTHTVSALIGGTDDGTTITKVGIYGTLVITKATGGYTYTLANGQANVQALADGQHVTDVFTYTNSDNHGGSSQSTLTVTITGTNDDANISVGSGDHDAGAVTEDAHESATETTSGTLSFSDVDLTDHHSVTGVTASSGALGTLTASVTHDTSGTGTGGVLTWNYSVADSAIDYLAAGQTKVETFTVSLFDGTSTVTKDVTVTITGTNDDANISVGSGDHDAGAVTEDAHESATETTSGTLSFSDVDLTDHHSVTGVTASSGALGTLTASVTHDTSGTGTGGVLTWNYSVADSAIDYLAAGQTKVETFTVSLFDGTSTVTKDVTVTITGTNDDANISVGSGDHDAGAVTEDAHESATETTSGTLSFSDVDLTDHHSVTGVTASSGALGTLTASVTHDTSGTGTGGVLTWNYSVADSAIDYLAAGQTKVETFTVSLFDGTSTVTKDVTVTITGTNDDANISVGSGDHDAGAVTEDAHESATETTSGTLSFSDVDLTDHHSVTGVTASSGALGTLTASVTHDTSGTGTGGVLTWNYSVADSAIDYLAAGQTKVETFTVSLFDGTSTVTKDVTVTITGTNDDANISVGSGDHDAGAVTEDAHESATETTSGTLSFSDVDLTDHHSVTGVTASSGALGTLTASVTHDTSGTGTGGVLTWNYSVADSAIDYLAAGQTKVETFTVSLFDGTSTVTKDVTVTITGTNDDANISVGSGDHDAGAVTEDAHESATETTSGTLSFSDVDLTDHHSVTGVTASSGALGTLTASVTHDTSGTGTGGVLTWNYSVADSAIDYLAAGQTKVETFTVSLFDGTSTVTKDVTVTITGTNDDANISVGSGDHDAGAVTEDAHESATETTSGTLSFSDVDLTDHHSVTGVTASSGALGTLTASVTHDTSGTGTGGVLTWNYSVADSAIDYLAAGQTKVETFTVSLFDGTSTVTKDVTVTITGTNDDANISVGSGDHDAGAVTEDAHESATETTSGTLSFSDVDLTDHHSVTGVTASSGALGTLTASVTHDTSGTGGVLTWNYSVADSAIDYLAAGQTKVETFTVSLFDGTSTVTKDVTVTITGTNDAPVITGGPITASVQEDGGNFTRATGQLTATDPDLTDTQTWSIVGASPTHAPNYQFKIDEFKIVKNGGVFFDDTFSDNNPPPSAPTGFGSITSYSVTGTVSEQDGKAILTGADTGFGTGSPTGDPFFGEYATLNTNTDPTNTSLGLKANSSFTVSGAFDLTLPAEDRNAYGIRLTDRTSSQAGDSTVELRVARGADGIERVQLREIDFSSHTTTVLQSFTLSPGSHDQILLSLTNDAENTGVIHASFELEQGGVLDSTTLTSFAATGTIFNNENWTRAQFFAEAPQQSDSVLQGTYGQLDITQSGAWTYQLANGQANVQALAAGQTAQDIFIAQVADGHGGFDTKTITVNVTGSNDAPVAVADVAAVKEDTNTPSQPNPVSGNVLANDTDVDIGDTHTVTKVNGSSGNVGHDVAGTYGTLHLNADGSYTYTLANGQANVQALADGQHVTDVFTYTNSDNHGGSNQSTLTVTVNGTNDAPVAVADVAAVTEDALPNTVNGNVLANDTDVDNGDTHTVSAVSGGTDNGTTITKVGIYGTLVITKATGGYTYTLANSQANVQALADGQHVTDVFSYTNSDNHGGSNQSTLTVTITGTNDAPTIAAGTTATGHIVAVPYDTAAPLTPLAASYLTAGHDLVNGLGGPSGFGESDVARGDDNSSQAIDIRPIFGAAGLNFFGHSYTSLYINNNGNITFGSPTSQFTPSVIAGGANNPIIAPFWADVDTRGGLASPTPGGHSTGANLVHYDLDSANGVMTITWDDVGYYSGHTNPLDAFQLQLISVGNGNFDIVFRYEDINWTTGDASGGSGGLGGQPARAGYSAGDGIHYFELSQSGNQAQMLALEGTTGNTGIAGVDVFEVRNGNVLSNLTSSGTILFSDADLADSHSVGVSLSSAMWSGGRDIPATTLADLAHALTTSMTGSTGHDSTGTGSGAIGWVFNLPRGDADFLAQDETLTVIYDVTIDDHHGGTVTQPVTVTITGAAQETDWNAATNGNWENAANWNHGVPSSSIAAVIAVSGTYTVSVSSNTAQADSLTVDNSHATLAADTGHSLTITGALTVDAGNISLTGGTIQAGSIDLEGAATLVGFGAVSGSIANSGVIEAQSSHTLDISGNISGTGSIEVLNHATLEVAGSVASTQTLSFAGGTGATGTLVLDHSLTQPFSAVISGLGQNDNIDLKDLTFTSSGDMHATTLFANGYTTLEVTKISTNQSVTFTLSGDYTHSTWIFAQDSSTGTIFHDPPAADAGATNVAAAGSTSGDLASTVTAALALQGGADDQFTFQAAQPDTLASATQNDATSQTALASSAAIGPDGSDTFVFSANFGHETIANFHPDIDVIAFDHTVFADFQAVLAAAHDDGQGNAVIAANSHDSVTIKNVTVTQLAQHQGDFHFT